MAKRKSNQTTTWMWALAKIGIVLYIVLTLFYLICNAVIVFFVSSKATGILKVTENIIKSCKNDKTTATIQINCCTYTIIKEATRGIQISHFNPKISTNSCYLVTNDKTKEKICFSGLHPHLIKYNFYEGEGSPYRIAPEKIISFFNLEPEKKKKINIRSKIRYNQ